MCVSPVPALARDTNAPRPAREAHWPRRTRREVSTGSTPPNADAANLNRPYRQRGQFRPPESEGPLLTQSARRPRTLANCARVSSLNRAGLVTIASIRLLT